MPASCCHRYFFTIMNSYPSGIISQIHLSSCLGNAILSHQSNSNYYTTFMFSYMYPIVYFYFPLKMFSPFMSYFLIGKEGVKLYLCAENVILCLKVFSRKLIYKHFQQSEMTQNQQQLLHMLIMNLLRKK